MASQDVTIDVETSQSTTGQGMVIEDAPERPPPPYCEFEMDARAGFSTPDYDTTLDQKRVQAEGKKSDAPSAPPLTVEPPKKKENRLLKRPWGILFSICFWGGGVALLVFYLALGLGKAFYISLVIVMTAWLLHLMSSFKSSTYGYLKNIQSTESAYGLLDSVKKMAPVLWYSVECYHTENRTRIVRDADGVERKETYQVSVCTYKGSSNFGYSSWGDVSEPVRELEENSITKLEMTKSYVFADEQSKQAYETARAAFFNSNRGRDDYMTTAEGFKLPGFKPKALCLRDPGSKPWQLNAAVYGAAVFFVLSVPYKWWFDKATHRVKHDVKKVVKA